MVSIHFSCRVSRSNRTQVSHLLSLLYVQLFYGRNVWLFVCLFVCLFRMSLPLLSPSRQVFFPICQFAWNSEFKQGHCLNEILTVSLPLLEIRAVHPVRCSPGGGCAAAFSSEGCCLDAFRPPKPAKRFTSPTRGKPEKRCAFYTFAYDFSLITNHSLSCFHFASTYFGTMWLLMVRRFTSVSAFLEFIPPRWLFESFENLSHLLILVNLSITALLAGHGSPHHFPTWWVFGLSTTRWCNGCTFGVLHCPSIWSLSTKDALCLGLQRNVLLAPSTALPSALSQPRTLCFWGYNAMCCWRPLLPFHLLSLRQGRSVRQGRLVFWGLHIYIYWLCGGIYINLLISWSSYTSICFLFADLKHQFASSEWAEESIWHVSFVSVLFVLHVSVTMISQFKNKKRLDGKDLCRGRL